MPRDSQGIYALPPGTLVNSGDTVLPSQHNPAFNDVAQALTGSLSRSGAGGMFGNLPMNGYKITGVNPGTAQSDAATVGQLSGAGLIGELKNWPLPVIPAGYLLCDGRSVSRTTYAALFALYQTTFGSGDGSTTFNLPDARGVVMVGADNMGGTSANRTPAANTIGAVVGSHEVTLTIAQMPSHSHAGETTASGSHNHTLTLPATGNNDPEVATAKFNAPSQSNRGNATATVSTVGDHTHGINLDGGGQAHNNLQPSFVCNIIVKAL